MREMNCPLCQTEANEETLIPNPYWQDQSLELAHRINPEWNEADGCCKACFGSIMEALDTAWTPTKDFGIRGLKDGFRYVLTNRQTGQWNHQNPDLKRWHQQRIVDEAANEGTAAGFDEWFIFDATETVLAQGRAMDT